MTFETDLFSTNSLGYVDENREEIVENPNTYDGIHLYEMVRMFSTFGIIIVTDSLRKLNSKR